MAIEPNPTTLGRLVTKPHFDMLYRSAILADTGGTPGGAQTIPGDKTFSGSLSIGGALGITGITTLSGGKRVVVSAVSSSPVTITDTDGIEFLLVTTGASAFVVNLPDATKNAGRILTTRKVDAGAGKITVTDGVTTWGIWYLDNFLTFLCDGTGWLIIGAPGLVSIPGPSRPGWLLSPTTTRGSWTDWDLSSYAPPGAKSVRINGIVYWTGNGAYDYAQVQFRKDGSSDTDPNIPVVIVNNPNLGSGLQEKLRFREDVDCSTGRVIEYYLTPDATPAAPGIMYATIFGYSMMG